MDVMILKTLNWLVPLLAPWRINIPPLDTRTSQRNIRTQDLLA
jgi:hypothetical protein